MFTIKVPWFPFIRLRGKLRNSFLANRVGVVFFNPWFVSSKIRIIKPFVISLLYHFDKSLPVAGLQCSSGFKALFPAIRANKPK